MESITTHVHSKNETYSDGSSSDSLWTTYGDELCDNGRVKNYSLSDIISLVRKMSLEYEEHRIPFDIDITECFNPDSHNGEHMLAALTEKDNFYQSFTPEVRKGMLDHLRNKCSTEKDGKIIFNNDFHCIIIHT